MTGNNECRDLMELHPKLRELAILLIAKCKDAGLDMKTTETYRTIERQDWLYAQGRTRLGSVVTYARGAEMESYHQWRLAFDICQDIQGRAFERSALIKAGKIGESLGFEWGGSWKSFPDLAHFQYTYGLSIEDLKSGKKPPEYILVNEILSDAVKKLTHKGIAINESSWNKVERINLNNVEALFYKLAMHIYGIPLSYIMSINRFVIDGIISSPNIWTNKQYTKDNVASLIIKVAAKL